MKLNVKMTAGIALTCLASVINAQAYAAIDQVRVVNNTNQTVEIHVGGYATSQKIAPGKWALFTYPFKVIPPGANNSPIQTSLLVATAGGQWDTDQNGLTSLKKPSMMLCIDYNSDDLANKTGSRKWIIKALGGFDKGCEVKPFKQPWFQG